MKTRTVTLLLAGGHAVRLGGAVDISRLTGHLEAGQSDQVLEIGSSVSERLLIRREALLGFLESWETAQAVDGESIELRPFVRLSQFLSPEWHAELLRRTVGNRSIFRPSSVTGDRKDYRLSMISDPDLDIRTLFCTKIREMLPSLIQSLSLPNQLGAPGETRIECQITAHGDGGFYHSHSDCGSPETADREISYVYYFRSRPDAFWGGELRIYETITDKWESTQGRQYFLIPPEDNSIVFFPSHYVHEVLPTYVATDSFEDYRFTLNGWISPCL